MTFFRKARSADRLRNKGCFLSLNRTDVVLWIIVIMRKIGPFRIY